MAYNLEVVDVGEKIKQIRELRNYTQANMAEELGLSQKQYSNIEKGNVDITMSRFVQICKILGVDPAVAMQFDSSKIFTDCTFTNHSGNYLQVNQNNKEVEAKDEHIAHLKKEVLFLRSLIENK